MGMHLLPRQAGARRRVPGRRCPSRVVAAAVAAAVVAGLAVFAGLAAGAGALDRIPLLDATVGGWVEATGCALLIAAWWRGDRRWVTRTLPALLLAVGVLVGLVALALRVTGTVTDPYPASFAIWVGAGFAALGGCPLVLSQRDTGRAVSWRRAAAVVAVPVTLAGALLLIDQQYGVWPQLGDVLGHSGGIGGRRAHDLVRVRTGPGAEPARGVVVDLDPPATRSGFEHRPGFVFLPPAYFGPDRPVLPVLVMLAGTPGAPINWLRSGHGQATDDAFAAGHHGRAPVLVVVDQNGSATGDTECVDGPQGRAETYLAVDVPAFVAGTLHIPRDPARWGIVGFSEGGTCALDLALAHPDVYRHVADLGGDLRPSLGGPAQTLSALFGGDPGAQRAHDPATLLRGRRYTGVTVWFGAGAGDAPGIATGRQLAADAARAGITTHRFVAVGGHNWQFAGAGFARILPRLYGEMAGPAGPRGG